MFKSYLRIHSPAFQLAVFLFLWAGFYLIMGFLQTIIIQDVFNVSSGQIGDFVKQAMSNHPDFIIGMNALFSVFIFAVPAFLFAYLAHPKPMDYLGLIRPRDKRQWYWVFGIVIGLVPVIVIISGLINSLNLGETAKHLQEMRHNQISAYLKGATGSDLLRNLVFLSLLPAFCEELLFRGIIQKFAFSFLKNAGWAIAISAFLFALMHMSIYDFLPIFLAGLVLAWLYQNTKSIWLNITVHFLFNGSQVVLAYLSLHHENIEQFGNNIGFVVIFAIFGLLFLGFSLKKMYLLRTPYTKDWDVQEKLPPLEN